jgi:hypothetical protein
VSPTDVEKIESFTHTVKGKAAMPMDKLSVSSASLFKSCPRAFYFREILGWESARKASWLVAGSAYDKLLEVYDLKGVMGANEAIPELFPDVYAQVDARFVLVQYHQKFGHDPMVPVEGGNQHGFGVPYYGNDVIGRVEVKVTGYIDKVSQKGDELIVTERKTTSEELGEGSATIEDGAEFWKKLPLDPQIRSYVWYLRSKGLKAGWVNYEVIRKPSKTFNKVFDKKGISLEDYTARLMEYAPVKTMVARKPIYVTEAMCEEFIIDHCNVHLAIQACKAKQKEIEALGYDGALAWTKHEGSCKNFGGCNFLVVDQGLVTLEQGDFVKSEKWLKKNGGVR